MFLRGSEIIDVDPIGNFLFLTNVMGSSLFIRVPEKLCARDEQSDKGVV